ncbi:MAG: hypothetical protein RL367_1278 [Pseudomonadota bacterium]
MADEIAAIGDLADGALLARAVEPAAGEGSAGDAASCLNCRAALAGAHCHNCGQKAKTHRSVSAFLADFFHSFLHFEGKIWRTLPMLAFKPGPLTRRYVHGERAQFVSPLALFLFSVFLMFSAFSLIGSPIVPETTVTRNGVQLKPGQIQVLLVRERAELARLKAAHAAGTSGLDDRIDNLEGDIKSLATSARISGGFTAKTAVQIDPGDEDFSVNTGHPRLDRGIAERIKQARDNPEALVLKMEANAHKFTWLMIPLSLPFVWAMFFWRRDIKLYDHIIFVTWSLSFVMLALTLLSVLAGLGIKHAGGLLLGVGVPLHMFVQLKGAYQLTRLGAAWRTVGLVIAAIIVLLVFAVVVVALGTV